MSVFDVPIKQFKPTTTRVRNLLIKNESLRDDLELTIVTIWNTDVIKMGIDPKEATMLDFMRLYREGKLTSSETIRRSWQLIQEQYESLRGKNWNRRHKIADQVSRTIVL